MSSSTLNSLVSNASSSSSSVEALEMARTIRRPSMHQRQFSKQQHNVAMRELIKPWGGLSESPAQCQRVMYSCWSRFKAVRTSTKSSEELKASVLWAPSGAVPGFNPPQDERFNMRPGRADADAHSPISCGVYCLGHQRVQSEPQNNSWSTISSDEHSEGQSEGVTFKRKPIKATSTTSLLTRAIRRSMGDELVQEISPIGHFGNVLGKELLTADMLPSAFDSDSEDEDEKYAKAPAETENDG